MNYLQFETPLAWWSWRRQKARSLRTGTKRLAWERISANGERPIVIRWWVEEKSLSPLDTARPFVVR